MTVTIAETTDGDGGEARERRWIAEVTTPPPARELMDVGDNVPDISAWQPGR